MNDFDRNIWCLLGLPFDAIDMQQAIEAVRLSVIEKTPCFLSTPNLNFLIASQSDPDFRNSVINSELSIADGMPLIWAARLLGIPFPGRVAGSGLIEVLRQRNINPNKPVKVFFFGGEAGVAEQACQVINKEKGGLTCAGFHSPGFGSVRDMSDPGIIDTINQSNANFVIVSLGAKKGQAWIEQNREKLFAPVISHLGAVVNFVAGNVKRAPVWMQRTGLEWIWRIQQEPKLWRRYFRDGIGFISLFVMNVLPYVFWRFMNKNALNINSPVTYDVNPGNKLIVITIHGNCVGQSIDPLRNIFRQESTSSLSITLDLTDVSIIDGAFLGLCLVLYKHQIKNGLQLRFNGLNKDVKRLFHWNRVDYLL